MCGIVGYIGERDATEVIVNGLKKLEYRGYDSAGIAVNDGTSIQIRRDAGKLSNLIRLIEEKPIHGKIGIGHTRWATHGMPTAQNAHPHASSNGEIVIVHNGIVENYQELRTELQKAGVVFKSETDTETIVQLIEMNLRSTRNLEEAVQLTLRRLKGSHGIVAMSLSEPDKIIAARLGNAGGVVIGMGRGENFIASDIPAILEYTRRMVFLENRQIAIVTRTGLKVTNLEGAEISYETHSIGWDPVSAEKGTYRHFMQKEIHEQVRTLTDTLAGRASFDEGTITLPELHLTAEKAKDIRRILITACGTAAHAGMVGKIMIENLARIPVEVQVASEFRYADPILDCHTVVLAISQSGETADTLAAMEEGRRKGATVWSIVNAIGSQAMRVADGYIGMQTGPEIGVASTKAFTAPLLDLYMLALVLADMRGDISAEELRNRVDDLRLVPQAVGWCLEQEERILPAARAMQDADAAFYLGRGIQMPIAFEGALKLKEISYIHAEGFAAGEMKHGPIALIDQEMPVIALVPRDPWYEKMMSQVEQVKSRGGKLFAVATRGDDRVAALADHVLWIPDLPWLLCPVASVIPLQVLAYQIASLRGLDVDQPRNLAKSVTVE